MSSKEGTCSSGAGPSPLSGKKKMKECLEIFYWLLLAWLNGAVSLDSLHSNKFGMASLSIMAWIGAMGMLYRLLKTQEERTNAKV